MASPKLRVLPLGGLGEIGKNMTVVELDGKIVLVDTGLRFPTAEMVGIDLVLPDFHYLRDRVDDIEAIVLTHGHEDHVGALPWMLRELATQEIPSGSTTAATPAATAMSGSSQRLAASTTSSARSASPGRTAASAIRSTATAIVSGSRHLSFRSILSSSLSSASTGSSTIYGPLAAPIAVLIWLYVMSLAVLVGAAFNAAADAVWPGLTGIDPAEEDRDLEAVAEDAG